MWDLAWNHSLRHPRHYRSNRYYIDDDFRDHPVYEIKGFKEKDGKMRYELMHEGFYWMFPLKSLKEVKAVIRQIENGM